MQENEPRRHHAAEGHLREKGASENAQRENLDHRDKRPMTQEEKAERKKKIHEQRAKDINAYKKKIVYSDVYYDEENEYRHVTLPKEIAEWLPHYSIMTEEEWRSLGVRQSEGWEHYMVYAPEPHILLFKREKHYAKKYLQKDKTTAKESQSQGESLHKEHANHAPFEPTGRLAENRERSSQTAK